MKVMFVPPGMFNGFQGHTLKFRQYLLFLIIVRQKHKGRMCESSFNLRIKYLKKENLESQINLCLCND